MSDQAEPHYPRSLTERERAWIEWILPHNRPGYTGYRRLIDSMVVIGTGRRGEGEVILGKASDSPDLSAPLPPVFAYGVIETDAGTISVTLREVLDDQISLEIVINRGDDIPATFRELRRWTYSEWNPGDACPQCGGSLREIPMHTSDPVHTRLVLAFCTHDRRMWVHDHEQQVNRLIPVTNFYNELMLQKNIRDPRIALEHKRLFTELSSYTDKELAQAFLTYNRLKTKVHIGGTVGADDRKSRGILDRVRHLFSGKQ